MFFLIGKFLLRLILLCNSQIMNPIVSTLIKGMLYFILKAKQGGKYLNRKQVVDRKTGKMRYQYKYKPMQQRAAHEVTRGKFEKVTKLSGDEHKNQIEHTTVHYRQTPSSFTYWRCRRNMHQRRWLSQRLLKQSGTNERKICRQSV